MPEASDEGRPLDDKWKSASEILKRAKFLPREARRAFAESVTDDPAVLKITSTYWDSVEADQPVFEPSAGERISHYEIIDKLGEGGMGRVYSARDLELGRTVALKFLPRDVMARKADTDRLVAEAQAASALNHPNIITVHEVVRVDSSIAIVMEQVKGESLRRMLPGPLDAARVIELIRQAASAMAAAHAAGIIHRDLKPENIMVRSDGYVKVLDFGLARQTAGDGKVMASLPSSALGTGTFRYMSPEQADGKSLTSASDVFSLGLVMYEAATGEHPFESSSPIETAYEIATRPPDAPTKKNPRLPKALETLILEMLGKEPAARPAAREVAERLAAMANRAAQEVPPRARFSRGWMATAAAGLLCAGGYLYFNRASALPDRLVDTRVDLGAGLELDEEGFALSPDGQTVVFHAKHALQVRPLSGNAAAEWKDVEGAYPFWSADGKEIGYYANKKIWRKGYPQGTAREICDAHEPLSAAWGPNGIILFSSGDGPILSVNAAGGTPVPVTKLEAGDLYHAAPAFLPDGKRFVFYAGNGSHTGRVMLSGTKEKGRAKELAKASSSAVFLPRPGKREGRLVFASQGALIGLPFDASSATVTGEREVLTSRVREPRRRLVPASASMTGALVYAESEDKRDQAKIFDREGRLVSKFGELREYTLAIPAPDFTRIALVSREPADNRFSIEVYDRQTGQTTTLPTESTQSKLAWAPDGGRLVVGNSVMASGMSLMSVPPDSRGQSSFARLPYAVWPMDWSYDGRAIIATVRHADSASDIWSIPLDAAQSAKAVIDSGAGEDQGHLSKDGRYLAYQSKASGHTEVVVVPYPPDGRRWQISTAGGQEPRWRNDGKEIFYLSLDYALMSVKVQSTPLGLTFSTPSKLFGGRYSEPALYVWHAEPSGDGKQFVILTGRLGAVSPLRLRLNWWAAR